MKVTEPLANVAVRVSPSSVSALGPLVLVLRGAAAVPAAVADLVGTCRNAVQTLRGAAGHYGAATGSARLEQSSARTHQGMVRRLRRPLGCCGGGELELAGSHGAGVATGVRES